MTLGSLCDGSGGFTLGAKLTGITPVWASEIEPFPIRVTTKRMPEVKHYGDITKLDGGKLSPVDIITFGSPCQNLSIAGNREGLDGKRSGLFFEALRVIKEMREKTNGEYPKIAVWENVCGAFTSNKGEDFRTVLEGLCRLKEPDVHIPKAEKWKNAGVILGADYSLAWRVLDAQYWGVPQRRKRIYLVADFTSGSAGKILFESEGLSGYSAQSFATWQKTAGRTGESFKEKSRSFDVRFTSENTRNMRANVYETEISRCIDTGGNNPHSNQGGVAVVHKSYGIDRAAFNQGRNALYNFSIEDEKEPTIVAKGPGAVAVYASGKESHFTRADKEKTPALVATDYKEPPLVSDYIVRRITPTECARLQGFPDWWCEGLESENPTDEEIEFFTEVFKAYGKPKTEKQIRRWLKNPRTDSAEYKMWGNGVALPNVVFVLAGIAWSFKRPSDL